VPGNFHISTHAHNDIIVNLEMQGFSFDFSHKINHVTFGREADFKDIIDKFHKGEEGSLNPLNGLEFKARSDSLGNPI
jgi:hypothetical protein